MKEEAAARESASPDVGEAVESEDAGPASVKEEQEEAAAPMEPAEDREPPKYRGVRKRPWGKYVAPYRSPRCLSGSLALPDSLSRPYAGVALRGTCGRHR